VEYNGELATGPFSLTGVLYEGEYNENEELVDVYEPIEITDLYFNGNELILETDEYLYYYDAVEVTYLSDSLITDIHGNLVEDFVITLEPPLGSSEMDGANVVNPSQSITVDFIRGAELLNPLMIKLTDSN